MLEPNGQYLVEISSGLFHIMQMRTSNGVLLIERFVFTSVARFLVSALRTASDFD